MPALENMLPADAEILRRLLEEYGSIGVMRETVKWWHKDKLPAYMLDKCAVKMHGLMERTDG